MSDYTNNGYETLINTWYNGRLTISIKDIAWQLCKEKARQLCTNGINCMVKSEYKQIQQYCKCGSTTLTFTHVYCIGITLNKHFVTYNYIVSLVEFIHSFILRSPLCMQA